MNTNTTGAAGIVKRGSNRIYVDPRMVARAPGWNPRFDKGEVEALALSIADEYAKDPESGGLLNDIRVAREMDDLAGNPIALPEGKAFFLVDGDRRLTAIELLLGEGVTPEGGGTPVRCDFAHGVPAKIDPKGAPMKDRFLRMFKANDGKLFLPVEEAHAFQRMKDVYGMTIADIEEATGKSDNYIVGSLALLQADPVLVEAVKSGEVSAGVAKSIAVNARGDAEKQKELVADAKAAGKDKAKRRAVLKKIDDARRAKAAKKGKALKMRTLDKEEVAGMGARAARLLVAKAKEAEWVEKGVVASAKELETEDGLKAAIGYVARDGSHVAAYTLGFLMAMRAVAGMKSPLDL